MRVTKERPPPDCQNRSREIFKCRQRWGNIRKGKSYRSQTSRYDRTEHAGRAFEAAKAEHSVLSLHPAAAMIAPNSTMLVTPPPIAASVNATSTAERSHPDYRKQS